MVFLRRDDKKFTALITRYQSKLTGVAALFFSDVSKAEDAVQESFIKLMPRMDMVDEVESVRTEHLCITVLINTCRNMLRDEKRRNEVPLPEEERFPASLSSLDESLPVSSNDYFRDNEALNRAVRQLNPEVRDMLWLRYEYGLSAAQIGKLLGKTTASVQKALVRARKKLKEILKGGHHEE